jgi:hypothetical protein
MSRLAMIQTGDDAGAGPNADPDAGLRISSHDPIPSAAIFA